MPLRERALACAVIAVGAAAAGAALRWWAYASFEDAGHGRYLNDFTDDAGGWTLAAMVPLAVVAAEVLVLGARRAGAIVALVGAAVGAGLAGDYRPPPMVQGSASLVVLVVPPALVLTVVAVSALRSRRDAAA